MAEATYDAIVIGGGHQGLIIACYLQKAGMKTAIFERQSKLGGGVVSEEGPVPGFLLNPCAHWTRSYSHPAYNDFNLRKKGLEYIFPEQMKPWFLTTTPALTLPTIGIGSICVRRTDGWPKISIALEPPGTLRMHPFLSRIFKVFCGALGPLSPK